MKKIKILLIVLILLLVPNYVYALNEVNIYLFYKDNCSICSQEKVYLEALKERYPNMRVYTYEVNDSSNMSLMEEAKSMYNVTESGVPFTVIGDSAYLGFSQSKKALFQKRVYEYSTETYENKLGVKLGISYSTTLEGEVEEYTTNDSYTITETSGKETTTSTSSESKLSNEDIICICLVVAGVILGIIVLILNKLEKRGRI